MAQIHALTPDGKLPTAAVAHVKVLVAEDLDQLAATVDKIKLTNQSAGEGAPTGTAPVGWVYTDLTTGDVYRMEA